MTTTAIARQRLLNQQITQANFKTASEMVGWLGAVQAQDYAMAKWAIGVRLPSITDDIIEKAINDAAIIRTHILRPTWHFVSAEDIYWMLALSAPQIRPLLGSMNRNLDLDNDLFSKSNNIIIKALESGTHLTREELMKELETAGIKTDSLRSAHIMFAAELEGLVCNGCRRGKQFTYALLEERVPQKRQFTREEAIAALANRYFTSHGPATVHDFSWWSGFSVTDARKGLEAIAPTLVNETLEGKVYWFAPNHFTTKPDQDTIYFLPAFDEFMVSYKDRTASLSSDYNKNAITGNGIFKPIIVVNGRVTGIWKRSFKKDTVWIEPSFFDPADTLTKDELAAATKSFGQFLEMEVKIV